MKVGTCTAERGRVTRGGLRIASGADEAVVPVAIATGQDPGRTVFVSAGVHGDEVNGVEVVQRLMGRLALEELRGTVIFLPLINVAGFRAGVRTLPQDGKDLNRCFPGDAGGTFTERLAHVLWEQVLSRCDFGVDVHDSGTGSVLLPHPRAHIRDRNGGYDPFRMAGIAAFGSDLVMLCRGMEGVMTLEASRRLGIPAFTVEVGGALILWEAFIHSAVVGLQNLLIYHGLAEGKMVLPRYQYVIPGEDDVTQKSPLGGVLRTRVRLGQAVSRQQLLAEIRDPVSSRREQMRSDECGIVHDLNVHGKVDEGGDVVGVLAFTSCPERGRRPTSEHVDVLDNRASDRVRLRSSAVFDEALTLSL